MSKNYIVNKRMAMCVLVKFSKNCRNNNIWNIMNFYFYI